MTVLLRWANRTQWASSFYNGLIRWRQFRRIPVGTVRLILSNKAAREVSKKGKRNVQGVPQSQTAALPRPQEEEETDKSKQAQTLQTYEKH